MQKKRAINHARSFTLVLLPFIAVFSVWYYFAIMHAIPFWQIYDDYPWYSMSHAFTMEAKFLGYHASNLGYSVHPGLPFGFASWLAFRLATLGIVDGSERIAFAAMHGEAFWLWAKIIALLLTLGGLYAVQRGYKKNISAFFIAIALYFASLPAVYNYALFQLTNESFALVYMTAFYSLIQKFFILQTDNNRDQPCFLSLTSTDILTTGLGVMTSIGCAIKIYYIAPTIGLMGGLFYSVYAGTFSLPGIRRIFAAYSCGLLISGGMIVFGIMGRAVFSSWLQWNWSMLRHADRYGTGDSSVVGLGPVMNALTALNHTSQGSILIILSVLILLCIVTTLRNAQNSQWKCNHLPFIIAIGIGIFISFFGVLKHYGEHYALPVSATLPCLLFPILSDQRTSRIFSIVVAIIATYFLFVNFDAYSMQHKSGVLSAEAQQRDLAIITNLPIAPQEKRVWVYLSANMAGRLPSVNDYAHSEFVTKALRKASNTNDITPENEPDARNWKYVIFPKTYFPSVASISENYRTFLGLSDTQFQLRDSDTVRELEKSFVLTRN